MITAVAAQAGSATSRFCDRGTPRSAAQQDQLLRFSAVVRDELDRLGGDTALISRSGLDLSRFGIRYSHAGLALKDGAGRWNVRQLYYACDEGKPRLFDQGVPGFVMGTDDPGIGYIAIVRLEPGAAASLKHAALDLDHALRLVAAHYSANAYPFSLRYQNCNQWIAELFALAWGGLRSETNLRERAQRWLADAHYAPLPVNVGSHLLMFAANFIPWVHLDDHPQDDRFALHLRVSLPSSLEAFARERDAAVERVELCHTAERIVVRHGWMPITEGCVPEDGDRVEALVSSPPPTATNGAAAGGS